MRGSKDKDKLERKGVKEKERERTGTKVEEIRKSDGKTPTSLERRVRWEIKSVEVVRDGEKLGQGGFGAVYKGYAGSFFFC